MTGETAARSVSVEIFGRTYQIRSQDDHQYILKLAKMVNIKMAEVEQATKTVDSIRVAVLTALNLADQLLRQQVTYEARISELEQETQRFNQIIQQALEEETVTLPDS